METILPPFGIWFPYSFNSTARFSMEFGPQGLHQKLSREVNYSSCQLSTESGWLSQYNDKDMDFMTGVRLW
jgi:hypothetical protein